MTTLPEPLPDYVADIEDAHGAIITSYFVLPHEPVNDCDLYAERFSDTSAIAVVSDQPGNMPGADFYVVIRRNPRDSAVVASRGYFWDDEE